VPTGSRPRFFAAAIGAAIAFAVFGLLTSLAPSFVAGTLHHPSHLLAGAVPFAAFATAALAQTLTSSATTRALLTAAIAAMLIGLGLLTIAVWLPSPSLGIFVAGDIVVGIGCGLMFKGAIATVAEIAAPVHRAEALAGIYLAAYIGLAVPVVGLGALTQIASTRVSLLTFAGLLALGILAAAPALTGDRRRRHTRSHTIHAAVATSRPSPPYRPMGHVIGHAIGEPPPPPRGNRPMGHVIGHAIGEPPPPPRGNRPAGHVIGRPNAWASPQRSTGRNKTCTR
jgi:MFS family permease